jgi:hypothetical protein
MTNIPQNLTEFLYWVKEQTEAFWSIDPKKSAADFVCDDWIFGAKWIGLTDNEINNIEKKYTIKFTPEHREFLKILHTIDRMEVVKTEPFDENTETQERELPFFYNWLQHDELIKECFNWPLKTILEDVRGQNKVWLESWGTFTDNENKATQVVTNWYCNVPKLIPLTAHRFLVSDINLEYRPILSVWGSDIIVYGWNLRSYLLNELQDHLNIQQLIYDEEDNINYPTILPEVQEIFDRDFAYTEDRKIPYLEEMIVYWSSGLSSFGLKHENDGATILPVTKTRAGDEQADKQKTFDHH